MVVRSPALPFFCFSSNVVGGGVEVRVLDSEDGGGMSIALATEKGSGAAGDRR